MQDLLVGLGMLVLLILAMVSWLIWRVEELWGLVASLHGRHDTTELLLKQPRPVQHVLHLPSRGQAK